MRLGQRIVLMTFQSTRLVARRGTRRQVIRAGRGVLLELVVESGLRGVRFVGAGVGSDADAIPGLPVERDLRLLAVVAEAFELREHLVGRALVHPRLYLDVVSATAGRK